MSRRYVAACFGILLLLMALTMVTRPGLMAQKPSALISANAVSGAFGGSEEERLLAKSIIYMPYPGATIAEAKTRCKLLEKIPMNFPDDTTLENVKKYIEAATTDKMDFPDGIQIYVDPQGLLDADKTMASTIAIQLRGIPLETTLRLLLQQLSLTYWVNKDGLLIITSASSEDPILTQGDIDKEILSNLNSLRLEVKELREELRTSRAITTPLKEPTVEQPRPRFKRSIM